MSKAGGEETNHAANAGGDEAFISFAFVIVSVVMLVVYASTAIRVVKVLVGSVLKRGGDDKRKVRDDEDSLGLLLTDAKNYFWYIPSILLTFVANPGLATSGLKYLLQDKSVLFSIAIPKFLKNVLRVRLIIVILWVVLFSMALYTNLSFDAYKVLDLAPDATEKQVKSKYRKLTKIYHPDFWPNNATNNARYANIRKAYKALVNKEEFEKEAQTEDLSVGVALPSWITNRENDLIIKLVVLAALIGFPVWMFRKFSGNDGDKISKLCKTIVAAEMNLIPMYANFGIPVEKKMVQRNNQVQLLKDAWKACGVPIQDEMMFWYFPAPEEFAKKHAEWQKHPQFFVPLGLREEGIIHQVCDYIRKGAEENKAKEDAAEYSTTLKTISDTDFEAAFYVYNLAVDECEKAIDDLNTIVNNSIKQLFVLKNFHRKTAEVLVWAQQKKLAARDIDTLIEAPRVGRQEALGILPSIQQTIQKVQKQQQKEYQKQMKGIH